MVETPYRSPRRKPLPPGAHCQPPLAVSSRATPFESSTAPRKLGNAVLLYLCKNVRQLAFICFVMANLFAIYVFITRR